MRPNTTVEAMRMTSAALAARARLSRARPAKLMVVAVLEIKPPTTPPTRAPRWLLSRRNVR
jgi:hypothetical protein